MCAQESRLIPYQYELVFEEVKNALIECGFQIKHSDFNNGVVQCSMSESGRAWFGEKVEIFISRTQNGSQVNIRSSAKGPMLTTFGKSDENIKDFFLALNRRLQQSSRQPPPQPNLLTPPPPPPKRCPLCNEIIRYVPEYFKWYCDKCQKYL